MLFSSITFLYIFLPLALTLYFVYSNKNVILTLISISFFAIGEPRFTPILILLCFIDYFLLRFKSKYIPSGLVTLNLLVLIYYKYLCFFTYQASIDSSFIRTIVMPLGVSFFTFHKISYILDVSRGAVPQATTFKDYLLYIFLFPQLIAGPIIRFKDICVEIQTRTSSIDNIYQGLCRFTIGLSKKVLLSNHIGDIVETVATVKDLNLYYATISLCGYSLQIYLDFSGYSDMAIGLGRMFGFHIKENFNFPYLATSITDFWKRWHISLSTFIRDYLYIPLGGNKQGNLRTAFNLWFCFLISGFWHGPNWTFIIWGFIHGSFLFLEKLFKFNMPVIISRFYVLLVIASSWCFFKASTVSDALLFFTSFTKFHQLPQLDFQLNASYITIFLFLGTIVSFSKLELKLTKYMPYLIPILWLLCTATLLGSSFNPFIYFRF